MKKLLWIFLLSGAMFSCDKEPLLGDDLLDGNLLFDPSLNDPERYLLSYAIPNPTPEQAALPVILLAHGYTATTFEWDEFRDFTQGREDLLISQVLLGGHGRSYADFKQASWRDWQAAIMEEYSRLEAAGYQNIHLVGSSTSCALFLELIASGYFNQHLAPKNIFLIDPIVIPSNKTLSLVGVLGPMLGYLETEQTAEENKVYYRFRPQETLQELHRLLTKVRKELEEGLQLPAQTALSVYKSKKDPTADPVSAVLIYKGLTDYNGKPIAVEMVPSELHVFTRLALRSSVTAQDQENQRQTFEDILSKVMR
jgi:carboxylesterase